LLGGFKFLKGVCWLPRLPQKLAFLAKIWNSSTLPWLSRAKLNVNNFSASRRVGVQWI
jgi:hypothetical protein